MNTANAASVTTGYAAVAIVLFLGYALRRWNLLPSASEGVLNRVTLTVTTPALYVTILVRADLGTLVSSFTLASLLPLLAGALLTSAALVVRRRRPVGEIAVLAGTSIYTNVGNIGVPIATAVLGSASFIAPMILIQVLVVSPALLIVLETTRGGGGSLGSVLAKPFRNPIIVSAVVGTVVLLTGVRVSEAVLQPFDLIGQAAIPIMLLAFGMSLGGSGTTADSDAGVARRDTFDVAVATVVKVLVVPLLTLVIARSFGLTGTPLLAAVVIAALPTAQNIYAIAAEFRVRPRTVRRVVLVSTGVSFPVALAAATFLA